MTPNTAYQCRRYSDIDIFYNTPISDLPAAFPQDFACIDGPDTKPNLCIESAGPANPRSFRDSITNEEYECMPMAFVESEGGTHPPNRVE